MENQKSDMQTRIFLTDCRGCPYPSTGFLCGGSDGKCMKTRVQKINNTELDGERKNVCN